MTVYEVRTIDGSSHYSDVDPLSMEKGFAFVEIPIATGPTFQGQGLSDARKQIASSHVSTLRLNLAQVAWIHEHRS